MKHVSDVGTLRRLSAEKGDGFRIFGGTALTGFEDVTNLMKRNPDKVSWFYAPGVRIGDYFTEGYMPFLAHGEDHAARRGAIMARCAEAHGHLDDLERELKKAPSEAYALTRFCWRHFVGLELSDEEVESFLYYRKWAAPLSMLPSRLRRTVFLLQHRKVSAYREAFLDKLKAASVPFYDSWWDILWFQSASMFFHPERALEAIAVRPDLLEAVKAEVDNAPNERFQTRAILMEVMRLFCRIGSTNDIEDGEVKIALLPVACMDPERYEDPEVIRLDRDQSDSFAFAVSSPRGSPRSRGRARHHGRCGGARGQDGQVRAGADGRLNTATRSALRPDVATGPGTGGQLCVVRVTFRSPPRQRRVLSLSQDCLSYSTPGAWTPRSSTLLAA